MTTTEDLPLAVTIEPLAIDDVAEVAAIHVAAFEETVPDALAHAAAALREELGRAWAHVHVARCEGRCVGASVAWVVADELHVLDVATHPAYRRRGIGRLLVEDLILLARGHHAIHLYLEVRRGNLAALALYRGAGFAAVGLRERYYGDDEDAIEMALELDPNTGEVVRRADEATPPPRLSSSPGKGKKEA